MIEIRYILIPKITMMTHLRTNVRRCHDLFLLFNVIWILWCTCVCVCVCRTKKDEKKDKSFHRLFVGYVCLFVWQIFERKEKEDFGPRIPCIENFSLRFFVCLLSFHVYLLFGRILLLFCNINFFFFWINKTNWICAQKFNKKDFI